MWRLTTRLGVSTGSELSPDAGFPIDRDHGNCDQKLEDSDHTLELLVVRYRNQPRQRHVSIPVDQAIDFELPDQTGKPWRLAGHLARGPVLLVFYRGDW